MAEARLLARRAAAPDLLGAAAEALRDACGAAAPPGIIAAAERIAMAVEAHGASFPPGAEPAYHDRHHQAEATLAMGWLAAEARAAGLIDAPAAALCVLAMLGHDLLHDGDARAAPGSLEARSAEAALALLPDLPAAHRAEIRRLILLTDLHAAAPRTDDAAGRLVREADLFGSLTPCLGWRLSHALALEETRSGQPDAARIATYAGRLTLLRSLPEPTPASAVLGLHAACTVQHGALARATGAPTAEAGAAALDRMPAEAARRCYVAAMAALGMPGLPGTTG
jgi:hypothetical protein